MYLIGNKVTKTLVYSSAKYYSGEPTKAQAEAHALEVFGLLPVESTHYVVTESEEERIMDGCSFSATFDAAGDIVSVDFSEEDSKPFLHFSSDVEFINHNDVSQATITVTAKKEDGSIDSSVQGSKLIPMREALGNVPKAVFSFNSGVATRIITSSNAGKIVIPAVGKRYGSFRYENKIEIESLA